MKRESLYLQGGLALNSWYAETEATRNGREQSSFPRARGGPSSPRRVFDRTGVTRETPAHGGQTVALPVGIQSEKSADMQPTLRKVSRAGGCRYSFGASEVFGTADRF